uniref:SGNH/GDSL hydrolase family protein n=1 Tax=Geminicoccus roseus TaxID=404900 RepID=UPI00146FAA00|nr:SGNH/GDSL hydrolase family protein [Geminicoccus roseus]
MTIVAIGSSSTYGTGATSPKRSYPSQLAEILSIRYPNTPIEVINSGIGGETISRNLMRFERDVLAYRPNLVIWQVGTNDAFQGRSITEVYDDLQTGIARIRNSGADIVLMEAQYFPDRPDTDALRSVREAVRQAANDADVELLPRHALMRHWIETGRFSPATMLMADRIHMTDSSYHCLAERVADLLPAAGSQFRPIISASAASSNGVVAVPDPIVP